MGCLYEAVNTKTGKRYIGVTVSSLEKRRAQHERAAKRGSKYYFHRALLKHGLDCFTWHELMTVQDKESLYKEERAYLTLVFAAGESVYNTAPGGRGGSIKGRVHSEVAHTRKRGCAHHRYGTKQHSETVKKRSGTNSSLAKLDDKQVLEIKRGYLEGMTLSRLSGEFHVGTSTISRVVNNTAWADVRWPIAHG